MEEVVKKENNMKFYICIGAAAVLGYAIGKKAGYNSFKRKLIKEWRQVNISGIDVHLYYPKMFESEIVYFFDKVGIPKKEASK